MGKRRAAIFAISPQSRKQRLRFATPWCGKAYVKNRNLRNLWPGSVRICARARACVRTCALAHAHAGRKDCEDCDFHRKSLSNHGLRTAISWEKIATRLRRLRVIGRSGWFGWSQELILMSFARPRRPASRPGSLRDRMSAKFVARATDGMNPDERFTFDERVAICMFDGGLSEAQAIRVALEGESR